VAAVKDVQLYTPGLLPAWLHN